MVQKDSTTEPKRAGQSPVFVTTRWSMVVRAAGTASPDSRRALEQLCQTYWYPLYAYVRRCGHAPPDAQDLTQEFFARLIADEVFAKADKSKGRFRSFLLGVLKHFLAHEWEKSKARKRGGHLQLVPLSTDSAEIRYSSEPATDDGTPDRAYDRQWALALLDLVLGRLRKEYAQRGRDRLFDCLKQTLSAAGEASAYREVARQLEMSEAAVKIAAHRMRQRYRALLREEIAHTLDSPQAVEEELQHLFSALSPRGV